GFVGSGMARYALCIGMDSSQGRPGDALEYTTGAGGAAYVIGPKETSLAYIEASYSYVTDTPDFFRRPDQHYPQHGHRFTGEPAYFKHVLTAGRHLMEELGYQAGDYAYAVFHQPNAKFPIKAGQALGFSMEQMKAGLLVSVTGNTYAGSSLLGLTNVLDQATPGERVLLVSFGSGAGSDAFSLVVTDLIEERKRRAPLTRDYVARKKYIDYALYARFKKKLQMH
ncbi:MAG: hydroxymethylglutaryl-CoA synthase, partial [Anaerolineae bacterium]